MTALAVVLVVIAFALAAMRESPVWSVPIPALVLFGLGFWADANEPATYDMPGFARGVFFVLGVAALVAGAVGLLIRVVRTRRD